MAAILRVPNARDTEGFSIFVTGIEIGSGPSSKTGMKRLALAWVILILVGIATVADLRTREVHDGISLAIFVCALLASFLGWSEVHWPGLIVGLLLGLACSMPFFYFGGLGGADVKLIASLGASLGPVSLLCMFFWMAIAGGLLAIVTKMRGRKDFAYVPAIAIGLLIQTVWPEGLRYVLLR
jgi:prepilin peptidase CpaA